MQSGLLCEESDRRRKLCEKYFVYADVIIAQKLNLFV